MECIKTVTLIYNKSTSSKPVENDIGLLLMKKDNDIYVNWENVFYKNGRWILGEITVNFDSYDNEYKNNPFFGPRIEFERTVSIPLKFSSYFSATYKFPIEVDELLYMLLSALYNDNPLLPNGSIFALLGNEDDIRVGAAKIPGYIKYRQWKLKPRKLRKCTNFEGFLESLYKD